MLNNKGQSLVLFILILPILLGIMVLVIDMGNVFYKKNEIDNTLEFILDYGLESIQNNTEETKSDLNKSENKAVEDMKLEETELDPLRTLLQYNLEGYQNEIRVENKKLVISSKTYVKGIFSNILGFQGFLINSEYEGYLEKDNKVIQKIK